MKRIAVFDSNNDVTLTLGILLRWSGFHVSTACLLDMISGDLDLRKFLEEHDPEVIVYDIPYPYEDHCRLLDRLMEEGVFNGRKVVLITTNPKVVKELEGCRKVNLLLEKPFEYENLIRMIRGQAGSEPAEISVVG